MCNDTPESPTAPLPNLSQFFTWAPGEEPAPADPPPTQLRPAPATSPPTVQIGAIDIVGRPAATDRNRRQRRFAAAAAVAAALAVATALLWPQEITTQEPDRTPPAPTTTDTHQLDPRLASLLPPGYPLGTCVALPATNSAAQCGSNADVPETSARYTLYPDSAALTAAFDRYLAETTVRVCPGGYQSPGPWRRNAAPSVAVGTLVCGIGPHGRPRIGWTLNSELLFAAIESSENGPTLAQLYDWWSTHS